MLRPIKVDDVGAYISPSSYCSISYEVAVQRGRNVQLELAALCRFSRHTLEGNSGVMGLHQVRGRLAAQAEPYRQSAAAQPLPE